MSNPAVLDFIQAALSAERVAGRSVLEVGSFDRANDSVRQVLAPLEPAKYIGVDIEEGPGVDVVGSILELVHDFGPNAFDVVLCTETIEHVEDWRTAVNQLKDVTAPGGTLIVTTRSRRFHLHAYPHDYWRFEHEDFAHIFGDMNDLLLRRDGIEPGIFVRATKPEHLEPRDLSELRIYSVAFRRRIRGQSDRVNQAGRAIVRTSIATRELLRPLLSDRTTQRVKRLLQH